MKRIIAGMLLLSFVGAAAAQGIPKSVKGASSDDGEKETSTSLSDDNHKFYIGADYVDTKLSVSNPDTVNQIPVGDYDLRFVDIRAGYRLFNAIGIEGHYGVKSEDASADGGTLGLDHYYGVFVVPTATVFDAFEIGVPLGYARTAVTRQLNGVNTVADLNSVSFGVNFELPIRVFWGQLPDVRLTGGGTVYDQKTDARLYGFHFGARFDFGI
jgi:hypothetical protein